MNTGSHKFPKLIQPTTPQLPQGEPGVDAGQLWAIEKEGEKSQLHLRDVVQPLQG